MKPHWLQERKRNYDQLDLLVSENVKFADQLTDRFDIRYVSDQFPFGTGLLFSLSQ